MDLVDVPLRLPASLHARLDRLGELGGLTGEQMAQAIILLQFHGSGWLKEETADPKPETEPQPE